MLSLSNAGFVGARYIVPGKNVWLSGHHPPRFLGAVILSGVSRALPLARCLRARNAVEGPLFDLTHQPRVSGRNAVSFLAALLGEFE